MDFCAHWNGGVQNAAKLRHNLSANKPKPLHQNLHAEDTSYLFQQFPLAIELRDGACYAGPGSAQDIRLEILNEDKSASLYLSILWRVMSLCCSRFATRYCLHFRQTQVVEHAALASNKTQGARIEQKFHVEYRSLSRQEFITAQT